MKIACLFLQTSIVSYRRRPNRSKVCATIFMCRILHIFLHRKLKSFHSVSITAIYAYYCNNLGMHIHENTCVHQYATINKVKRYFLAELTMRWNTLRLSNKISTSRITDKYSSRNSLLIPSVFDTHERDSYVSRNANNILSKFLLCSRK